MTAGTRTHRNGVALLAAAGAAVAGAVLSGCSITPAAAHGGSGKLGPGGKLVVGYTAIGAAYDDLYVCQDAGVFRRNGLNVKLTPLNTASQLLAALSSGSVQIGVGPATSTAVGILKGIQLRYIANPAPRYYLQIWGKKSIAGPDDLVGKSVAVSSPGSLSDEGLKTMLAARHLTGKVTIKYLKSIPAEVTALEHGAVDSIVSQPPNSSKTAKFGMHEITDLSRYAGAANVYTVSANLIKDNQPTVRAFIKSEEQCLAILHNDPKQAIASIEKHSGTDDAALDTSAYRYFDGIWDRSAKVQPRLISESFAHAAAKQGTKPPPATTVDKSIDNSFIDSLSSSGYISSLYRGR